MKFYNSHERRQATENQVRKNHRSDYKEVSYKRTGNTYSTLSDYLQLTGHPFKFLTFGEKNCESNGSYLIQNPTTQETTSLFLWCSSVSHSHWGFERFTFIFKWQNLLKSARSIKRNPVNKWGKCTFFILLKLWQVYPLYRFEFHIISNSIQCLVEYSILITQHCNITLLTSESHIPLPALK